MVASFLIQHRFQIGKKPYKIQSSCLSSIMVNVKSSPIPEIEVESSSPSLNIRYRWLTGKFLLKSLSLFNSTIFDSFYFLFLTSKSLPILSLMGNSISDLYGYILTCTKTPRYERDCDALIITTHIHVINPFLGIPTVDLSTTSPAVINHFFSDFINCNFPDFITVYTDGSVSLFFAGYS